MLYVGFVLTESQMILVITDLMKYTKVPLFTFIYFLISKYQSNLSDKHLGGNILILRNNKKTDIYLRCIRISDPSSFDFADNNLIQTKQLNLH
jgi:hypothetical protein